MTIDPNQVASRFAEALTAAPNPDSGLLKDRAFETFMPLWQTVMAINDVLKSRLSPDCAAEFNVRAVDARYSSVVGLIWVRRLDGQIKTYSYTIQGDRIWIKDFGWTNELNATRREDFNLERLDELINSLSDSILQFVNGS